MKMGNHLVVSGYWSVYMPFKRSRKRSARFCYVVNAKYCLDKIVRLIAL